LKETREAVDKLESIIGEKEWPLPTYQQMLFRQD
jgi:glutamine synthetase type III